MSPVSELKSKVSRAAEAGASVLQDGVDKVQHRNDPPNVAAHNVAEAARAAAEKISDAANSASAQITDAVGRLSPKPKPKRKSKRLRVRFVVGLGALGLGSLAAFLGKRQRETSSRETPSS
jgi:hypothetical protein